MRNFSLLILAAGLLMCGCLVPSLHPLFTDKDITVRSELTGDWVSEDGDAIWLFQLEPDSSYSLAYVENNDTSWFVTHLVQLRNRLFMDMYPDPNDAVSDAYKVHLVAAHTFSKIEFDSGIVTMSVLDADWLRRCLDSGKLHLAHELLGPGDLVLTASTSELQKFMLSIVDDSEAFAPFRLLPLNTPADSL
jgi:hypothetical protein